MSLFPDRQSNALYFSMNDPEELMGRYSEHEFNLDGQQWPTVEHYYQAMKFVSLDFQTRIRQSPSAEEAHKLGQSWLKKKRTDFKQVRTTLMTRAIYTKAKTYSNVAQRIIETGDIELVDDSQFDYFWGCGRDHRGDNHFGKVIMNVRKKLISEGI